MNPPSDLEDVEGFFRRAEVAAAGEPRGPLASVEPDSLASVELEETPQRVSDEQLAHARRFRRPVAALIGVLSIPTLLVIARQGASLRDPIAAAPLLHVSSGLGQVPNRGSVVARPSESAIASAGLSEPISQPLDGEGKLAASGGADAREADGEDSSHNLQATPERARALAGPPSTKRGLGSLASPVVPLRQAHPITIDERSSHAFRQRTVARAPARNASNSALPARATLSSPAVAGVSPSLPSIGRFPDL